MIHYIFNLRTHLLTYYLFILLVVPIFYGFDRLDARTINFAGYDWDVKQSSSLVGPGPNYFSDATNKVWSDSSGLHMTITYESSKWWCTEVILQNNLGYGTYLFHTRGRVDTIDANMVLGLFTWDNGASPYYRELDFEFARWGNSGDTNNSQYVVQPYPPTGNRIRYRTDLTNSDSDLTLLMIWSIGTVTFKTYRGHHTMATLPTKGLVTTWRNTSGYVPTPGNENIRINFWLYGGSAPISGFGDEVLITNFEYSPIIPRNSNKFRYLWCWSNNSIINNLGSARTDFFDFCTAPFGNSANAITHIYLYANPHISTNTTNLRNFIVAAHNQGMQVIYLDGDPSWATPGGRPSGESIINSVLTFNSYSLLSERFDGIQFDVEPYALGDWNSNKTTYWSTFTTLLSNSHSSVNQYNSVYSPDIYFEVAVPRWYDSDGDPVTSHQDCIDLTDSIAVMDYVDDSTSIINDVLTEILYSVGKKKYVVVGVETQDILPTTSTFYDEGNVIMENHLTTVHNTLSGYSSYLGIAIHYYDSYKNLYNSSGYGGGIIWDFDSPTGMPSSVAGFGSFYVFMTSTVAGKGIGGTNALEIDVPSINRSWGGGFDLNASSALDLSSPTTAYLYGWISASTTSPFGIAFEVEDISGGYQFIPPPGPYTSNAQIHTGSINTTFKPIQFDLRTFDRYGAGTGAPDLSGITQITFILPDNTGGVTGPLKFYLDNIGASIGPVPVELSNFYTE